MTLDEIKEKNQKENIFGAPTTLRAGQIFSTVSARIKAFSAILLLLAFFPVYFYKCNIE